VSSPAVVAFTSQRYGARSANLVLMHRQLKLEVAVHRHLASQVVIECQAAQGVDMF